MEPLKSLLDPRKLKFNVIDSFKKNKQSAYSIHLDKELDTLLIYLTCPVGETVAHFVDENLALLYNSSSLEVIGFQVEDFTEFIEQQKIFKKGMTVKSPPSEAISYGELTAMKDKTDYFLTQNLTKLAEAKAKYESQRVTM